MPRSTGGGSHSGGSSSSHSTGGGSHSSGYSSSRSSYGSSSSSYSSSRSSYSSPGFSSSSYAGTSRPKRRPSGKTEAFVSKRHFAGAQRYVYYRDQKPHYIYSNYTSVQREKHPGRLTFYVILVISMIMAYYQIFTTPARLENAADTRILLQDSIGVIEDAAALEQSLQAFLDTTGITPGVVTMTNESWRSHYTSLAAQAYDLYVNSFSDEQHWLIVYTQPETPDADFVDWHWEGMAGDDTAPFLTDEVTELFNSRLQRYLTMDQIGVGEALSRAFDEAAAAASEAGARDLGDVLAAVLIVVCTALLGMRRSGLLPRRSGRPEGLPADAVLAPQTSEEGAEQQEKPKGKPDAKPKARPEPDPTLFCAYCGGAMGRNAVKCPHCGAARTERKPG